MWYVLILLLSTSSSLMEHIQIPPTVVFETMLRSLGLPCPRYENRFVSEDHFDSKVLFYLSMHSLRVSPHPHIIHSYPALTLEAAIEDAARQGIEYMEKVENKVPSSFRAVDLQKEKQTVRLLHQRLDTTNRQLIAKSSQLLELAVACDTYAQHMTNSTRRIGELVSDSLASNCAVTRDRGNGCLLEIQSSAVGLSQHTANMIAMLNVAEPSLYAEEPVRFAQSSDES
jgi:hypothetical protein